MSPSTFRFELSRDMYQTQRDRREQIRASVATPVAALAFSIFNLSNLALNYGAGNWAAPVNLSIGVIGLLAILSLLIGAILIVRMEKNIVYLDPPDLQEIVSAEQSIRDADAAADEQVVEQMHDVLAGAYDIVYRRYFAANEQAARDRTKGLRFVILALMLLTLAYALLPFQTGTGIQ